ncbi:MAG: SAP domain-containing protein [Planctomycetia bacterium]|nr:SAP domain-containing protein [Planctomycetia bacterium]
MNMADIRLRAADLGIEPGRVKKEQLIHEIQLAEGFNRDRMGCEQLECAWRKDCKAAKGVKV